MTDIEVSLVRADEKDKWRKLFDAYSMFYNVLMEDAVAETVWKWSSDPHHAIETLVARTAEGELVGLANIREMPRPLSGSTVGFIDDFFVLPEYRRRGVATALVEGCRAHGQTKGWPTIRLITDESNAEAQAFYDRVASHLPRRVYQIIV